MSIKSWHRAWHALRAQITTTKPERIIEFLINHQTQKDICKGSVPFTWTSRLSCWVRTRPALRYVVVDVTVTSSSSLTVLDLNAWAAS